MNLELDEIIKSTTTMNTTSSSLSSSSLGEDATTTATVIQPTTTSIHDSNEENDNDNHTNNNNNNIQSVDRFYAEHFTIPQGQQQQQQQQQNPNGLPPPHQNNNNNNHHHHHHHPHQNIHPRSNNSFQSNFLSYLEEKGIFWTNHHYRSNGISTPPSIPSFFVNRSANTHRSMNTSRGTSSSSSITSSSRGLSSRRNRRFRPPPPFHPPHLPPPPHQNQQLPNQNDINNGGAGIEFFALFDEEEDAFHLDRIYEQGRIVGISDNVVVEPGNHENLLHFDFGRRMIPHEEDDDENDENEDNLFLSSRRQRRNRTSSSSSTGSSSSGGNNTDTMSSGEKYGSIKGVKTSVNCHKHLYHQHLRQRKAVNDEKGGMIASELSLSVDFFHPNETKTMMMYKMDYHNNSYKVGGCSSNLGVISEFDEYNENLDHRVEGEVEERVESFWDLQVYSFESECNGSTNLHSMRNSSPKSNGSNSDSSGNSSTTTASKSRKSDSSLHEVVQKYEQRLMYHLERCDYTSFDECVLDFWDEYFPITATIHFHDKHSPVPRLSYMRRFLSRPCPEAFGTVQCEIERIKVYNKSKGVNMTGRLFPTYEYRLFIRDRRNHPTTQYENFPAMYDENESRMDTILMTAKHKTRHQQISCGKMSSSRKGVNNYLFYMPRQEDIDDHLDAVNDESVKIESYKQTEVPGSQFELGRLQSNFIGTEFQIFGPRNPKNGNSSSMNNTYGTVEEVNGNNVVENNSTSFTNRNSSKKRSKNKFRLRRKLWRQSSDNETNGITNDHNRNRKGRISPWSSFSKKTVNRHEPTEIEENIVMDKELGAITYTANLLGNRPRVMDVCVPKLSNEMGLSIPYESNTENPEEGSILSNLKRLSHQLLHLPPQQGRENDAVTADLDNLGLMSLQNRPPWWNVELGAFVLNFGGRVSVASVKNFQLCDRNDHENIMLQFGRIDGRHSFTMDFSYPLSPLQAFAIAVSSLQSKISFA